MADKDTTLLERLSKVQTELKVPKGQRNTFGNYNYRNAEDILEAAKPLLAENRLALTLSDELVQVGDRYYVKASAQVQAVESDAFIFADGYAREEETKKGMDGSQITGAASSYARKYALNGLFLIDDTKDSDATNDHGKAENQAAQKPAETQTASAGALVHPTLMKEVRDALRGADLLGDVATHFVQATIGKPAPRTNDEAQQIIDAVKKLEVEA